MIRISGRWNWPRRLVRYSTQHPPLLRSSNTHVSKIRTANNLRRNWRNISSSTRTKSTTRRHLKRFSTVSPTPITCSVCRWVQVKPTWWRHSSIWICILHRMSLTILLLHIISWWWLLPAWNPLLCRVWSIYRSLTRVGSYRNQQPPNSNGRLSSRFWMSKNRRTRATVSRTRTRRRSTIISPWRIWWAW